jgi:hypothetical protein
MILFPAIISNSTQKAKWLNAIPFDFQYLDFKPGFLLGKIEVLGIGVRAVVWANERTENGNQDSSQQYPQADSGSFVMPQILENGSASVGIIWIHNG